MTVSETVMVETIPYSNIASVRKTDIYEVSVGRLAIVSADTNRHTCMISIDLH